MSSLYYPAAPMNPRPVMTLAEAEALPPDKWMAAVRTWREAGNATLERFAWHMACWICCEVGKEEQHRAIIATCARNWKAKADRGEASCSMHEGAVYFGRLDKCACHPCKIAREAATPSP
jgi:hypothetical protein